MTKVMPFLGLEAEPIPLWWTSDFINAKPVTAAAPVFEGDVFTPTPEDRWIVGEFNCSCVGISYVLDAYATAENPTANFYSTTGEKKAQADELCSLIGLKANEVLDKL